MNKSYRLFYGIAWLSTANMTRKIDEVKYV
jgi:hypothetical protein